MGPTTVESPTHARSNNCGTVIGGCGATVALSHPSAAAHAASSARGCHLKRRAHTAPHESGHVAHHQRKTRARDSRPCVIFGSKQNIPSEDSLPSKEFDSEALLIRGSTGAPDRQSQGLHGRAVQATLECGVRDASRSVRGRSRVPSRGIPLRKSIEPSDPIERVRAPPSKPL